MGSNLGVRKLRGAEEKMSDMHGEIGLQTRN